MTHACPDCGLTHDAAVAEAPVIVEEADTSTAAVRIAEIEAGRDVTIARIGAKVDTSDQETRIAALEGTLAGILAAQAAAAPPEPEPEPVPVVVNEPEPEPVMEESVTPPPIAETPEPKRRKGNPWWS